MTFKKHRPCFWFRDTEVIHNQSFDCGKVICIASKSYKSIQHLSNPHPIFILKALPTGSFVAALAIEGKPLSSEQFAEWVEHKRLVGRSHLTFIIGGSTGLSDDVKTKAAHLLSFGPITLPHQLARIVLLEQTYRAFRILRNEPYHK